MDVRNERRLTPRGRQTRQRIVSAAAELMHRNGVAGTTLDDVKAAAGASSSQLYHYFDDKDSLLQAVIAHQTDAMIGMQTKVDFTTQAGRRTWRNNLVDSVNAQQCRGGCPLGSLSYEIGKNDDAALDAVAHSFRRWRQLIESDLRTMQETGRLSYDLSPEALASALLSAVQGGLLLSHVERTTQPLADALDAILTLIAQ